MQAQIQPLQTATTRHLQACLLQGEEEHETTVDTVCLHYFLQSVLVSSVFNLSWILEVNISSQQL